MITEDALFNVIDAAVGGASSGQPLFESSIFNSLRAKVNGTSKTILAYVLDGIFDPTAENKLKERDCDFVIQCLSKVMVSGSQIQVDAEMAAQGEADEMAKAIVMLLLNNNSLGGAVCDVNIFPKGRKNFVRDIIDRNAVKYGANYLYGTINTVS